MMANGLSQIALLQIQEGQAPLKDHNGAHTAFKVSRLEFDKFRMKLPGLLKENKGPQQKCEIIEEDYGLQLSLFFKDPDCNELEVTTWVERSDLRRL